MLNDAGETAVRMQNENDLSSTETTDAIVTELTNFRQKVSSSC